MAGRCRVASYARILWFSVLAASASSLSLSLQAQSWGTCGSSLCSSSGAKVGIGTTSPLSVLHVRTGTNENLHFSDMSWAVYNVPNAVGIDVANDANSAYAPFVMAASQYVFSNGYVGIGVSNPVHPLQVAGTIGAEQVIVSSNGADYVLQPGYALTPLADLSQYIAQHRHLPDIPSAAEMQDGGVDIGALQTKLLAKIEELTLHQIELDRQNQELQQQVRELRATVGDKQTGEGGVPGVRAQSVVPGEGR